MFGSLNAHVIKSVMCESKNKKLRGNDLQSLLQKEPLYKGINGPSDLFPISHFNYCEENSAP